MGSTVSVINSYLSSIMVVMLPLAGMMLVFYSAYMLWRDLRGGDKKRILERLRDEDVRRQTKKLEQSIRKQSKSNYAFYETIFNQISLTKKVERWIEQANLNMYAQSFLLKIFVAAGAIVGLGLVMKFSLWYILVAAFLVVYLPLFALRFIARRRMKKLVNQLPDVFELISQALRAGHSLASGVQLIGKQIADPAGTEFARIFHEQNLGIKIEEALQGFADRPDQLDIRLFVTAVLIQRQTGGDLAEILDKIGEVIRDRIKIMGKVAALTAEGRMSGWVLSILPFFVFGLAWMINPDYANILLFEKEGQLMLIGAMVMQTIGILMIRKIINIKV